MSFFNGVAGTVILWESSRWCYLPWVCVTNIVAATYPFAAEALIARRRRADKSGERAQRRHVRPLSRAWPRPERSEEHTSELQSLMRISYAVFCLKKKKRYKPRT